jgi:superfamily II DNA or RNA helicase
MNYADFLETKKPRRITHGIKEHGPLHENLFPFQRDIVNFLIESGRAAAFVDTGLGKTIMQLEWSRHVPGRVIILAPLAVAKQTAREAKKLLGMDIDYIRDGSTGTNKVTITNYERAELFDLRRFDGVVLDESSILKSFMGRTKAWLCETFSQHPYRLACTATPAPNDYMELGNHSDFLGVMPANEMLSRWFINDTMNFGQYRLKGHAENDFWHWVASWAACVSKPSDLGYDDGAFALPPIKLTHHLVDSDMTQDAGDGMLFRVPEMSATSMHREKRYSLNQRAGRIAELINPSAESWIVWCETNDEADALADTIPDAIEVRGSETADAKEDKLDAFSRGDARVIITKPTLAGFGLNWQHCHNVAFASISYSYEQFYQAVRRSWRFGQTKQVNVHVALSSMELKLWETVSAKMQAHEEMKQAMRKAAKAFADGVHHSTHKSYNPTKKGKLPSWLIAA